jgi:outer membrane protein OmpA-like peptidoglycan-associated protein
MRKSLSTIAATALALPMLAGCATKGFVRETVATERTRTDSLFAMERSERTSADDAIRGDVNQLRTDLTALRADLTSLRDTFNVRITALENGLQFAMPVQFAFDDATVRPEDQAALDRFVDIAQKYYNGSKITIEGFADPAGSPRYNMALSQRRAEAVRSYLTEKGMMQEHLAVVGYGEARQVVQGAERDDPGAEKNRRVVFVIESRPDKTARGVASAQVPT